MATTRKSRTSVSRKQSRFANGLIRSLKELNTRLESGEPFTERYTADRVTVKIPVMTNSPQRVREVRELLNASQAVFAAFLGASLRSVTDWEQGRSKPLPAICRFMDEIRRNPDYFRGRLAESYRHKSA